MSEVSLGQIKEVLLLTVTQELRGLLTPRGGPGWECHGIPKGSGEKDKMQNPKWLWRGNLGSV